MAKTQTPTAKPTAKAAQLPETGFFTMESKICLGLLLLLLAVVATIRSKFSGIPFERDEGIYSYMGNLVVEGKIPYKDFYEQKFPGLFYFYGAIVALFGYSVQGLHTGFMYLNMLTIVIIYLASQKLFSPVAGVISAITYAFVSLTPTLSGFTVQAEHGVSFFISLGILCYAYFAATNKWYYNFLMGISFGMAFMTKTSGIFLVLWGGATLILHFLFNKNRSFKTLITDVAIYGAGGFLVIGFFFLLIFIKGSFSEMIFFAYEVPKSYVGRIKFEEGIKYFGYTRDAIVENHKFFWVHAFLAIGVCLLKSIDMRKKFVFLTLLVFSFLTIVPGYYFYGHYWIQTIPGLAILSGLTYYGIVTFLKNNLNFKQPSIKYAYLAIFVIFTLKHTSALKSYYFHPNYERIVRSVYGSNPFPEAMEIGNYINANSKPEDQVVIIGSEPEIYVYTNKKSPSRHAYFGGLTSDFPQHRQWQKEFIADVEKAKPRYMVFFNHAISLFVQPNSDRYIFEWTNKYITENYKIIGLIDMIDGQQSTYLWKDAMNGYQPKGQNSIYIYERNPSPAPVKP